MMQTPSRNELSPPQQPAAQRASSRAALLAMEADLRTLRGVIAACRIFSQSPDPIEPAALAVLVATGGEASERLLASWHSALEKPE